MTPTTGLGQLELGITQSGSPAAATVGHAHERRSQTQTPVLGVRGAESITKNKGLEGQKAPAFNLSPNHIQATHEGRSQRTWDVHCLSYM